MRKNKKLAILNDSYYNHSLSDLCNGKLAMQMLFEVSLEELAYYIVRGGWLENISVAPNKAHLMPRSYMQTIIDEDLNRLDDEVEYSRHKVELLLRSLARNETTTVADTALLKDIIENDNESMSRNTITRFVECCIVRLNNLNEVFFCPIQNGLNVNVAKYGYIKGRSVTVILAVKV